MRLERRWCVLAGLVVARIAFGFSFQALPTLAPGIAEAMALDALAIGTLVGLFMLPGMVISFPGGFIAQRMGERRTLLAGLAAMMLGALGCAAAPGYEWMWMARLLCGIGAAVVTVVMTKLVIDWFSGLELGTAMGMFLGGYPAGIGLALVSVGSVASPELWPVGFIASAALCAVALGAAVWAIPPDVVKAVHGGERVSLTSKEFILVSCSASVASVYNAGYLIMLGFVPLYLVSEGASPLVAAASVGAGVWVSILSVPLGGWFMDKVRRPNLIMVTGALLWAGGMLLVLPWSDSMAAVTVLFAVLSLVGAFPVGAMVALGSEAMRPAVRGPGMGLYYSWFYGAAALGPMLAGYVVDRTAPWVAVLLVSLCGLAAVLSLAVFRGMQRFMRVRPDTA